jgi:predicted P-loop ATPase
MSVIDFPTTPPWLKSYYDRGFRLIFYGSKRKGPEGQEALKWTERSDKAEDYKPGMNVGCFTGHEIQPGKFLVDIDFDWSDGLPLAKRILPATGFGFGRASRTISHSFYTSPTPLVSQKFENIDGRPIVELRGTKLDGTIGLQTMMPPSIHPSGEVVELKMQDDIGHYDNLPRLVSLYATACILYSALGNRGLLHDNRMAVAGFLLTEGLSPEEVELIGCSVADISGNNAQDFKLVLKTTLQRFKNNESIHGRSALIKAIGDDGKKVVARIKEWLGGTDFIEDSKGRILTGSQENVLQALEKLDVKLAFDMFSQKATIDYSGNGSGPYRGALADPIVRQVWLEVDTKFKFRPPKDFFFDVVENTAGQNKFHPVLDYLKTLEWDKVPRIEEWLIKSAGAADMPYVRAVSRLVLIAACRRVSQPGCKFDEMVVLESATQGLMKSTALRTLCPKEEWFSDDLPLNVDAKQIVERTLGKWIIEASDLSGMHASQVEHLKGMLSRQVDGPVRLAYARMPVEQPRQFIIIGTTNSYNYLTDSTGNRRFWPIRIQGFNVEWIRENRDQLWAEAFFREQQGESIRLDPSLYEIATYQQQRRRIEDPWEEKLGEAFPEDKEHRLTLEEAWGPLSLSIDRRDQKAKRRMLEAMNALGFTRRTMRRVDVDENRPFLGFFRAKKKGQLEIKDE